LNLSKTVEQHMLLTQVGLELSILLLQQTECWDCRCMPPHPAPKLLLSGHRTGVLTSHVYIETIRCAKMLVSRDVLLASPGSSG
jgi:hypothetical protein